MVGFVHGNGETMEKPWRNHGETHSEKDLHMVDKQHIDISDYKVYT